MASTGIPREVAFYVEQSPNTALRSVCDERHRESRPRILDRGSIRSLITHLACSIRRRR